MSLASDIIDHGGGQMNQSPEVKDLFEALAKAQGEIEPAITNSENPHFKSGYADLSAVWKACRGPLSKNGLSVLQTVHQDEAGMSLITTLGHSSGQWIRGKMHLLIGKQDMQGLGSAITYARRYSLAAIAGIAQDDDDGEGSKKNVKPQQPTLGDGVLEEGVPIPYGPLAKQMVHKADPLKLRAYILEEEEKWKNRGLTSPPPWAIKMIEAAEPIIAAFENRNKEGIS